MSLSLKRPRILGEVDQELLATLEELKTPIDKVDDTCARQMPLYEEIARLAGVELGPIWDKVGRSSLVIPAQSQLMYPNNGWHTENNEGYCVANAIPTEFLLAEENILREFWHTHCGGKTDVYDLWLISAQANSVTDKVLVDEGFEVWNPEPLEIVALGPTDMHRSTKNSSEATVRRNYAMIFRAL